MKQLKLTVVVCAMNFLCMAQVPGPYNVVVTEIMADPSPPVGLPNAEYIEISNTSSFPISLSGWRIGDGAGTATINANYILQPDSIVILCSNGNVSQLLPYGAALGISNFPSLDNDGETIYLRSKQGTLIHAAAYSKNWYRNAVKSEGGWSLEMLNTKNACSGILNWKASEAVIGGTPGKINSVVSAGTDVQLPYVEHALAIDSLTVLAFFNEVLDSTQIVSTNYYTINEGIGSPQSVVALAPLFNSVVLKFTTPLHRNELYQLNVRNLPDCVGNSILPQSIRVGWPSPAPDSFALVINELLFNPRAGGADYIELYNRSNAIIDLKQCYIAGKNSNGLLSTPKQLLLQSRLLFPGDYVVITEDTASVQQQYPATTERWFIQLSELPSMPDDKGNLVLLNNNGLIIDELHYTNDWHFQLISNTEGVALERVDFQKASQNAANWHSAATNAGYGTPGYKNSQLKLTESLTGTIIITPSIFSPDNDGWQDVMTLSYGFNEPGYVCNATIFDVQGRVVRNWVRSAVCGLSGFFRWDGLDNSNKALPTGIYVVYTEVFNLKGKLMRSKQVITLARKQQ
jgi:hypothetical protein